MVRIAVITKNLNLNGISNVVMNYCTKIDKEKFKITILTNSEIAEKNKNLCKNNNIDIIVLPSRENIIAYFFALLNILNKKKYDIVHVNGNSSTIFFDLLAEKLKGIKIRIAHSHNTTCNHLLLNKILYPLFSKLYTNAFACGNDAGKWMFHDKPFTVIKNGFDVNNFKFNSGRRNKIRKELRLENKYVIGHIGGFNNEKNQQFLLEIFNKIAYKNKESYLLLIGDGYNFETIKSIAENSPYNNRIMLYGKTNDSASMYDAMDLFVLPSLHEVLPVVLLEAQISGLPCVVSDTVTNEVDFGDIVWKSLNDNSSEWLNKLPYRNEDSRMKYFNDHIEIIKQYDIRNDVKMLENTYINIVKITNNSIN